MKKILSVLLTLAMLLGMSAGIAAVAEEPVTLTMFIDHSWYPVETFTGIIPEEITRLTGVTLDPTVAIDNNQLGVMIASGELPDIVYTQNMVDRMSDPEVSYSYEDLIAEYNVDWQIPEKQLGIARGYSTDGKAYTVLNHYSEKADWEGITGAAPMVGSIAVRGDLLDAIGNPPLTSFEEFTAAFAMIKEQYPDVVPLRLNENWNTLVLRYFNGIGGTDFVESEDGYIHYFEDARYKDTLMWLNECFRNGYIVSDDSYFVRGSTAIATDKFFMNMACTQNGISGTNADLAQVDPNFYVFELAPFEESSYITSDLGWSAAFITKSCKNPEAAINFIAWMFTPEAQMLSQMGRPGIDYVLDDNGLPEFSDEWKDAIAAGSNVHVNMYNPWFYLGGSEVVEAITRCATLDPAWITDAYAVINERFDNYPWIKAGEPIGDSDEKIILDKIKEMVKTYEAKIILAGSADEAEALYAEFLTNAERTGLKTLDEYVTNKIAEVMPLYK